MDVFLLVTPVTSLRSFGKVQEMLLLFCGPVLERSILVVTGCHHVDEKMLQSLEPGPFAVLGWICTTEDPLHRPYARALRSQAETPKAADGASYVRRCRSQSRHEVGVSERDPNIVPRNSSILFIRTPKQGTPNSPKP